MSTLQIDSGAQVPARRRAARQLVLVTGSGRSGTSLISGILQRLGCLVPQPEVPPDASNPRGFAESQWVVDFHTRLLRSAGVQTADARPDAWGRMAQVCLDQDVQAVLRKWLDRQFATASTIVIKDPRLSWLLPLWRRTARELDVSPLFVTMLRHPAAVVESKERHYGSGQEAGRTAGWVNQTLFTERATRDYPRTFLRYDDLVADWTRTVDRLGRALDLAIVRDAPANRIRAVHEFVDPGLARSHPEWDGLLVPDDLRGLTEAVWTLVTQLAEDPAADVAPALDDARAQYARYYAMAESVAHSSIAAAGRAGGLPPAPPRIPAPVLWAIRRLPRSLRHAVPASRRARIARRLRRLPRQTA